jgi:hypothetical protein
MDRRLSGGGGRRGLAGEGQGDGGGRDNAHDLAFYDFSDHNTYKAAWEQWGAEYEVFQERKTSGAVFIQDNGCGFSTLLVVTGPHRDSLWFDGRATCDQILPLNLGSQPVPFTDWLARRPMDLVGW